MATMRHNVMRLMMTTPHNDELPYLCFTAVTANSVIRLNKIGDPNRISLETSRDKKTWTEYHWTWVDESDPSQGATGDAIILSAVGDKVYWRECTEDPNIKGTFSKASNTFHFESEQAFICSGNIMSLLDSTLVSDVVESYAFYGLFRADLTNQNRPFDILTAPKLPATIKSNGSRYMYTGTSITSVKLDCTDISVNGCASICRFCRNITYMEVSHTSWGTNQWAYFLDGVTTNGTFVCPAALDTVNLPTNVVIPATWTIKKKGYYNNSKFYNDSALTTESILTAGEYYIDIPTNVEYYYDGTDLTPQN